MYDFVDVVVTAIATPFIIFLLFKAFSELRKED